jgi:hypothetical protein
MVPTAGVRCVPGARVRVAIVGSDWVIWDSAWGAAIGLPLMAAADLAWLTTLRRVRRWRRPPGSSWW